MRNFKRRRREFVCLRRNYELGMLKLGMEVVENMVEN
jgi:hypothetical protein